MQDPSGPSPGAPRQTRPPPAADPPLTPPPSPSFHAGRPPDRPHPLGPPLRTPPGPLPRPPTSTRDAPRVDTRPHPGFHPRGPRDDPTATPPRASTRDPVRPALGPPRCRRRRSPHSRAPPANWKASGARARTPRVDHCPEAPGHRGPQCQSGLRPPPPHSRPPTRGPAGSLSPASSPADPARAVAPSGLRVAPAPPAHYRRARLPAGRLRAASPAPRRVPRLGPPPPPRTRCRLACEPLGQGLYGPRPCGAAQNYDW